MWERGTVEKGVGIEDVDVGVELNTADDEEAEDEE